MFVFRRSDWSIAGSSGVTVTVGTPDIKIQVGLSYLRLPVKNWESSQTSMLQGVGGGWSGGVAPETPWTDFINITGSPDFYPSNGIGRIYRKVSDPGPPYVLRKLTGDLLVLSSGGAANFYGANLCLGLWLENGLGRCLQDIKQCNIRLVATSGFLKIIPGGFPWAILARTHAVGAFWGVVNTTDVAGVSGSAFQYRMQHT